MSETLEKLQETVLVNVHKALGAKMVPFAGYLMPVQYEGINAEHDTVRNRVGVFDVSHMGEFILKGEGALELIQRVTSNDASKPSLAHLLSGAYPWSRTYHLVQPAQTSHAVVRWLVFLRSDAALRSLQPLGYAVAA